MGSELILYEDSKKINSATDSSTTTLLRLHFSPPFVIRNNYR